MPKSINFITLGCSKNLVDSEKIMGNLNQNKYSVTHESDEHASIVIINTCGFINDAKDESVETILHYVDAKNNGKIKELIVFGCLSQRYPEELKKEIPEVDSWFGVNNSNELVDYLNKAGTYLQESRRILSTPKHYAYLKIAEGCDRTCSFCAIPIIRGKYRSRSINSLAEEAKVLAEKGVKELILIAQDISYYGMDIGKKSLLPELLDELVKIEGIEWIRLNYAYPLNFSNTLLTNISKHDKICKYLDVPLQHINSNILRSMKRGIDKAGTIEFINRLRDKLPGIVLRTTLMTGYPGETENDFYELLDFVKQTRFERLGVFTYSPEEGTEAYNIEDNIDQRLKQQRADILMYEQQKISLDINQQKVGKIFKVITDRREDKYIIGRTEFDAPEVDNEVIISDTAKELKQGMFYNVHIEDATEFEIYGSVV